MRLQHGGDHHAQEQQERVAENFGLERPSLPNAHRHVLCTGGELHNPLPKVEQDQIA